MAVAGCTAVWLEEDTGEKSWDVGREMGQVLTFFSPVFHKLQLSAHLLEVYALPALS